MNERNKLLGEGIKQLRTEAGKTLSEVAKAAGISAAHLSKIEKGTCNPTLDAIAKIAEVLEATVDLGLIRIKDNVKFPKLQ